MKSAKQKVMNQNWRKRQVKLNGNNITKPVLGLIREFSFAAT